MNKILIGASILLSSILLVENMVNSNDAYVLIWYKSTFLLTLLSLFIWAAFWFGIKWFLSEKPSDNYDDWNNLDF